MKREFLQGLQVGDMPLPKEVIDAIMAENGRDIEAVKARYADYDAMKEQLAQLPMAETALQAAKEWEERYNRQVDTHRREMSDLIFSHDLENAILSAKGRNAKAITALLDIDAIRSGENQQTALAEAMETLKQECSYLFQTETPPPYARGTGAAAPEDHKGPASLADALLQKFERK